MRKLLIAALTATAMITSLVLTVGVASAGDQGDCVPVPAYTEYYTGDFNLEDADWVLASPGAGWYQVDERTVEDTPAVAEIWEVFSPNDTQGSFEGPPSWPVDPEGTWQEAAESIPPGH